MDAEPIVGVDVGSTELVCDRGQCQSFKNTLKGVAKAVQAFKKASVTLVVVETTGGYERLLVEALWSENLKVAVVNADRVRSFANAGGIIAKTDPIDSWVIRLYGERTKHAKVFCFLRDLPALRVKLHQQGCATFEAWSGFQFADVL